MDARGAVDLASLLPPPPPPAPPPGCSPVRLWAVLVCGGCGHRFTADPHTVPCFTRLGGPAPACLDCWDRRNRLRAALGHPVQERPAAYPQDWGPV